MEFQYQRYVRAWEYIQINTMTARNRPFPIYLMYFPETLFGRNAVINNQRLQSAKTYIAPNDQNSGRDNIIHEERRKKIHLARIKRKYNVLKNEIKLNKLEYKLTSQKLYS